MARSVSALFKQAVTAQETGEALVAITSISHASIVNGPLRLVNNLQNVVSNGNTYTAFPFEVTLPEDHQDALPKVRLVLDNIDRSIVQAIRSIPPNSPPTVQIDLVLAGQPDIVELSFPDLTLRQVSYDALTIEGVLVIDEDDLEPFPADSFTPLNFPALFK
ncbi:MAG: DUF1833 family protein [Nitrospira sp.]